MFTFIHKIFSKSFNHNPKDFMLMITPSPVGDNMVSFKYSANGGKTWKYVYQSRVSPKGLIWEPFAIKSLSYAYSVKMCKNFSSYQQILNFEKIEREKYNNWLSQSKKKSKVQKFKKLLDSF